MLPGVDTHTHIHTHIHAHTHTRMHTHTRTRTHTHFPDKCNLKKAHAGFWLAYTWFRRQYITFHFMAPHHPYIKICVMIYIGNFGWFEQQVITCIGTLNPW